MNKSTKKELPELLEQRNTEGKYDSLIWNAKQGLFHDFESDSATPKVLLLKKLRQYPELEDVAQMVMNGEFDE